MIIFVFCIIFVGYNLQRTLNNFESLKEKYGYKVPIANLTNPVYESDEWTGMLLDADITYNDGSHNVVPFDPDKDGKVEIISNSFRSDALMIYTYDGDIYELTNWTRYIIDASVGGGIARRPIIEFFKSLVKEKLLGWYTGGAHYTAIADMNGDGRDDLIVAGDLKKYDIVWYEAPEDITNVSAWKKHVAYKNDSHRTYHIETGDIDGDGGQDIVFATKTDNSFGWVKNMYPEENWDSIIIDAECVRAFYIRAADLDRNGKDEIIVSEDDSQNGGKLHLYTYSGNPLAQESWNDRIIASFPSGHGVSVFETWDFDDDGDIDIVTGNHQGDVYILINPYPENIYREWDKYKVNNYDINSGHDFREIDVGDIDNDGDYDIVVPDEANNMVIWFENPGNGISENWEFHVIDKSDQYLRWCHCAELGDIDSDGDLDILVSAPGSNSTLIYINEMKKNLYFFDRIYKINKILYPIYPD